MSIELFGGNRMKILQINSVCGVGSTGRIATDLYKVLVEQGHDCVIAYGRVSAPSGIKTIKIGSNIDNYMHVLKTRVFDKHGFGSTKATKELIRQVKRYDPDVIHLHNIHGYYIDIEILFNYLKQANKPIVWTLHDCWAFTGHCSYFDYVGCNKWKKGCYDCPEKKTYPTSKFMDNSKINYEKKKDIFTGVKNLTIVTPSKWLQKLVKKSFLSKYPVEVINNGVDLDVFKPVKSIFRVNYNIERKFIILGIASEWNRRKGLKYFIELNDKLMEDEKIVLVGLTEQQKKELPQNIIGITRTNNLNELVAVYSAADVFINTTLEDNFPTTNIEALACGTPVITFDTGGSGESINTKHSYVVEKENINELLFSIRSMKEKNKIDETLFRSDAEKYFNKYDRSLDYIKLYTDFLANS